MQTVKCFSWFLEFFLLAYPSQHMPPSFSKIKLPLHGRLLRIQHFLPHFFPFLFLSSSPFQNKLANLRGRRVCITDLFPLEFHCWRSTIRSCAQDHSVITQWGWGGAVSHYTLLSLRRLLRVFKTKMCVRILNRTTVHEAFTWSRNSFLSKDFYRITALQTTIWRILL